MAPCEVSFLWCPQQGIKQEETRIHLEDKIGLQGVERGCDLVVMFVYTWQGCLNNNNEYE